MCLKDMNERKQRIFMIFWGPDYTRVVCNWTKEKKRAFMHEPKAKQKKTKNEVIHTKL